VGSIGSKLSEGSSSSWAEGMGGKVVTTKDLDFLVAGRRGRSGSVGGSGGGRRDDGKGNGKGSDVSNGASRRRNTVDDIGNELLGARDNPELEQRILRRSLKLSGGAIVPKELLELSSSEAEEDEEVRERSFHEQSLPSRDLLSERVHESTRALRASMSGGNLRKNFSYGGGMMRTPSHPEIEPSFEEDEIDQKRKPPLTLRPTSLTVQVISMVALTLFVMLLLAAALALGTLAVGPPRQPLGEYQILEAQVGEQFWQYYDFYAGKDSAGSNGYINYVSREAAEREGIVEVITEEVPRESMIEVYGEGDARAREEDWLAEDLAFLDRLKRKKEEEESDDDGGNDEEKTDNSSNNSTSAEKEKEVTTTKKADRRHLQTMTSDSPPPNYEPFNPDLILEGITPTTNTTTSNPTETFVHISSSPTPLGPRNSIRLEGRRRFNRGLFLIDLRHMPAGCGTWPAIWLSDEANWPVNGEIDIVEGVNYQNTAKTALHTTQQCGMEEVPEGSKTGSWDTAVGIPDGKTGVPDMTFRYAKNCFVYDPHQWINQGCVATDLRTEGRSLGMPLNENGGGVYALEWDPVNSHIRTWVFSPHGRVPRNLRDALRTATEVDVGKRVAPDTNLWGLPYGHFPIGEGTNCPSGHFRNMRLVINLAFCGSVAGNRYFMDCPDKFKKFKTCEEYVASNPEELKEAYWKIRGVYVYERAWERQWSS